MDSSVLIQAWRMAANDLGIEVVIPYVLTLKTGEEVQADVLVKDFGPMLIGTEEAEEKFRRLDGQLAAEDYGWSAFCGEELEYDRGRFIQILKDWGWTGPKDRRPAWCFGLTATPEEPRR
jgi:hypothetical protein